MEAKENRMTKTFKQFLLEEHPTLKSLMDQCGDFLNLSGGHYMLRGMSNAREPINYIQNPYDDSDIEYITKTTRQNRTPMDTAVKTHEFIDNWFNDHFGFRARSQALFVLGKRASYNTLSSYGKTYAIFPIGPIEYVWSPNVPDLFSSMAALTPSDEHGYTWEDHLDDFLTRQQYQKDGLEKAALSNCEVMIKCSKYFAFPISAWAPIDRYLDGK